jgi:hypothetical protein
MSAGLRGLCLAGARHCAGAVISVVVWTSWLLLLVALCFQIYIASVNEMPVPRFLLRGIEEHLAESGLAVRFGRASFDPSGRVLLQKAAFTLDSFAEPVVTADSIYIRVDPWALLARRFEPREIRATGANLFVPAMISSSGKAERLVDDLDAGFSIGNRGDEFSVDYLNCRIGGVAVSAHGTISAGNLGIKGEAPSATSLPLAGFLSKNYVALSRELSRAEEKMEGLDHASVEAVLTPSDTRGAIVGAKLFADSLRLDHPEFSTGKIRAACRFPLLGGAPIMTSAFVTVENLKAGDMESSTVRAHIRGVLNMDSLAFDPKQLNVTLGLTTGRSLQSDSTIVRVDSFNGRSIGVEALTRLFGFPVWGSGSVDLGQKSARVSFGGQIAPGLEDAAADWTQLPLRRFADFEGPVGVEGSLVLNPGWKFKGGQARLDAGRFTAYHVGFDEARGLVRFEGTALDASDAFARSGDYFVRGSYHQDFSDQQFRYLLTGSLRPLYITPWFGGDWWQGIFKHFSFPSRPAEANIDVNGRYVKGRVFSVFGYAQAQSPVVRGVPLDALRTLVYVDSNEAEGIEIVAGAGGGSATGSFLLSTEPTQGNWRFLDLSAVSTIDPVRISGMLNGDAADAIGAFSFSDPPSLTLRGHVDGPAQDGPAHKSFHVEVRAASPLKVHGVPFEKASFKVDVKDSAVDVSDIDSVFAGGTLRGDAHVNGTGPGRKIELQATLSGASLGRAAAAAEGYVVSSGKSTALDTFARDKSGVRLDIKACAEGRPGELASFTGKGSFQVQGSNLGELPLLGGLSKALKFPELRFTQAESTFAIADAAVKFPDLRVFGANSQIRASGTYEIERRSLDFEANIYPFMESKSLMQIFNAISAPISAVFRVRLTGSIDKPAWSLAYSPLTLLREGEDKAPAKQPAPAPLASPQP